MKNIILSIIAMVFVLVSCNQKSKEATTNSETTETSSQMYACSMHPEVHGKKGEACPKCGMELTEPVTHTAATPEEKATFTSNVNIEGIVSAYLNLKNKLVNDDASSAAENAKLLITAINTFGTKDLDANQKKNFMDIAEDAKEHAEHIGDNAGEIAHQREHFVLLSKDINDMIKLFGTKQKLYQDFCPMADNNKGAIWISETKDIKNPYFGSDMLTCGSIKEEF
ncbi:DUF3347 domain-containing protein [Flavobacterium sp. RSSA_27]|uniref:DUF3347 domain-containing protein n=1 Tax=Flavobacterium sp. RSSA_27 TaxID=3447667 RepID=UPI003F30493C